jgi:hypothetical protein
VGRRKHEGEGEVECVKTQAQKRGCEGHVDDVNGKAWGQMREGGDERESNGKVVNA